MMLVVAAAVPMLVVAVVKLVILLTALDSVAVMIVVIETGTTPMEVALTTPTEVALTTTTVVIAAGVDSRSLLPETTIPNHSKASWSVVPFEQIRDA